MGDFLLRCVVADDHPPIVDAVCRYLEAEEGITVVARSRDGAEALAAIEQLRPEVAVLDVRMPGLTGSRSRGGSLLRAPRPASSSTRPLPSGHL